MFLQGISLLFIFRPSTLIVVFLLLTLFFCKGYFQGGYRQQMVALLGGDVVLPCSLETPVDASHLQLEWARTDLAPGFIYVWEKNKENLELKQPSYMRRTSLSSDKLKHGDISLTLSKVQLSDEGPYRCLIPQLGQVSFIRLIVGSVSAPVIKMISNHSSRLVLQCESAGWYPEPELLWLDSEGNLLPAGPTETLRGPDDLYTVSSRVTVEKRHSNNITCRVKQKNINQSRETHTHVPGDAISESRSMIFIIIPGLVCLVCVTVVAVWKLKQTQSDDRNTKLKEEDGVLIAVDTESSMKDIEENSTSDQLENVTTLTVTAESTRQNEKNKEAERQMTLVTLFQLI